MGRLSVSTSRRNGVRALPQGISGLVEIYAGGAGDLVVIGVDFSKTGTKFGPSLESSAQTSRSPSTQRRKSLTHTVLLGLQARLARSKA